MADVRLTATNPEDSSVVPVACNEKGELKLEEPIVVEGPPGEKGDKGDKGDPGDPFSGNFADDVSFGGAATFADGEVNIDSSGNVSIGASVLTGLGNNSSPSFGVYSQYGSRLGMWGGGQRWWYVHGESSSYLHLGCRIENNTTDDDIIFIKADGRVGIGAPSLTATLEVAGDVVIGSRNKQWMIVESNGLAHLVEQTTSQDIPVDDELEEPPPVTYPPLRDIPAELTMVEQHLQQVMEKLQMEPPASWDVGRKERFSVET